MFEKLRKWKYMRYLRAGVFVFLAVGALFRISGLEKWIITACLLGFAAICLLEKSSIK